MGYQEIKQRIIQKIKQGQCPPNSLLPKEIDMAKEYGCSRGTVNRALKDLADQGLLVRKRKGGTRVCQAPLRYARLTIAVIRDEVLALGAEYGFELISRNVVSAPEALLSSLGVSKNSRFLHLCCMHYADQGVYQYEDRWIHIDCLPEVGAVDFSTVGPNEWLINKVPFTTGQIESSACLANTTLAKRLKVQSGSAVFVTERKTELEGELLTFVTQFYPGKFKQKFNF